MSKELTPIEPAEDAPLPKIAALTEDSHAYEIQEKLARLEAALLESTPGLPNLLRDIHTQLKKDPDVVTILTEAECATLVRGLKKQTATEIAVAALKGPKKKAMSKMQVGLDL